MCAYSVDTLDGRQEGQCLNGLVDVLANGMDTACKMGANMSGNVADLVETGLESHL